MKVIHWQTYDVAGPHKLSGDGKKMFAYLHSGPDRDQEVIHQIPCKLGSVEVWCLKGGKAKTSLGPATYFQPVIRLVVVGNPVVPEGRESPVQTAYVIEEIEYNKADRVSRRREYVAKADKLAEVADGEGVELEHVHEERLRQERFQEEEQERQVSAVTAAVLADMDVQRAIAAIIGCNSTIKEIVAKKVAELVPFAEEVQKGFRDKVAMKVYTHPSWNKA